MPSSPRNRKGPSFQRPRRATRRHGNDAQDSLLSGLETDDALARAEEEDALESTISGLTRLGPYVIERTLGVGAMGQVFMAREKTLDRHVALKVLKSKLNQDEAFAKRFLVEARAAAALDHPNIVRVYRVGKDRETGRLFMAMEYVEGKDLQGYLERGPPSFGSVLRIAMGVANALEHAREKRLLHRDVKPKNIMLGPRKRVLLLDFGLAKFSGKKGKITTITRTGVILGSPDYMSPEQFEGHGDGRSDLYSLGVVLYEMLAGTKPFKGGSVPDLLHLHRYAYPRQISAHRKNVPEAFERVLERLLAKNPDNRYATPRDLYKDLKRVRRQLESQGRLEDRADGPPIEPVTVKDSGNFDEGDVIDVRSAQHGVPVQLTGAARSRIIAYFIATLLAVGLITAGVTAWTQRVSPDPTQLLLQISWSSPLPAWTGSAGPWQSQGSAAWAHGPHPSPDRIALSGKGWMWREAGGTIWRLEGQLLDGGASAAGIFVVVDGAPYAGVRFRKLGVGTIRTFEVWHEDIDGVSLAALRIDPVTIGTDGISIMVSVIDDYAIFEVDGQVLGRKSLPTAASRFSLAVEADDGRASVWRDLSIRLGRSNGAP